MVALPLQCAIDRCTVCRLLAAAARGENCRCGNGRCGEPDFLPIQHSTLPLSPPSRPPAAESESLCPIIHQLTPTFKETPIRALCQKRCLRKYHCLTATSVSVPHGKERITVRADRRAVSHVPPSASCRAAPTVRPPASHRTRRRHDAPRRGTPSDPAAARRGGGTA